MLVLGIDPGLAATGYGLVKYNSGDLSLVEGGVIRSESKQPIEERVSAIYSGISEIIKEFNPIVLAMEEIYSHYKHPKTAVIMAHARGAILAAAGQMKLPVTNFPATTIKNSLTGNGRARKEQVREMVLDMLGVSGPAEPLDTYDALAVALCHINQYTRITVS